MDQTEKLKVDKIQTDIYKNMTPAQKLRIVSEMRRTAWKLKTAWLQQTHPDWTPRQIQDKVLEIFTTAHS